MTEDTTRRRSDSGGLADIHEASYEEKSTGRVIVEQITARWQTVLALVTLAATTYGLYVLDGGLSKDALIFGVLAVCLAVYFALTLRTDVKLE